MSPTKLSTPRLSDLARHVVFPSGIVTTGWPRVTAKAAELGIHYDPWQDAAGRITLGKRADGKYAATIGGVTWSIPRQVGKTFGIGSMILVLCILFPGLKVVWTAHRTRTSTQAFRSMQGLCRRKKIAPHIAGIRVANGEQEISFKNGSIIMFGARERGFGRGFDVVDIEVFDEAQILSEKALEDMIAATNQSQHPHGALLFFLGTPPRPIDPGEAFTLKRKKALSGATDDMVYLEFSADSDADPDDRRQWAKANPSYPNRTPLDSMLRLRENLSTDEGWLREGLGIWDELDLHLAVIPSAPWSALVSSAPPAQDQPPTALAVDMSDDRTVSIAGAWSDGDSSHVELLAVDTVSDTLAAAEWLAERAKTKIPVVIRGTSSAAAMIPALRKRRVKVIIANETDQGKACGGFFDAFTEKRVGHAGQDHLDKALQAARKRPLGKSGAWVWSGAAVSPVWSVTLAHYGAALAKPKKPGPKRVVVLS